MCVRCTISVCVWGVRKVRGGVKAPGVRAGCGAGVRTVAQEVQCVCDSHAMCTQCVRDVCAGCGGLAGKVRAAGD